MNSSQHSAHAARRTTHPQRGGSALTTAFVSVSLGAAALGGGALYLQNHATAQVDASTQSVAADSGSSASDSSAASQSVTASQGLVSSSTSGSAAQSHTTGS